ncbi:hypothetical protein JW868_00660 [Candidatus Woesearchaeota archaeon]|nr:hypothetical protein [Candidatus Woesearchaeota archaeon]
MGWKEAFKIGTSTGVKEPEWKRFNMQLESPPKKEFGLLLKAVNDLNQIIQNSENYVLMHRNANADRIRELSASVYKKTEGIIGQKNADILKDIFNDVYELLGVVRNLGPQRITNVDIMRRIHLIFRLAKKAAELLLRAIIKINKNHPIPEELHHLQTALPQMISDLTLK